MRARLHLHLDDEAIVIDHTAIGDTTPSSTTIALGPITLTRLELSDDPPPPEDLTNAIGRVQDLLDDAVRELLPDDPTGVLLEWADLTGSGRWIDTIAAVEIGLETRDLGNEDRRRLDGFALSRAAAEDVFRTMATEDRQHRIHNPGLPLSEVDGVIGACCIVVAVLRRLQSQQLTVSPRPR